MQNLTLTYKFILIVVVRKRGSEPVRRSNRQRARQQQQQPPEKQIFVELEQVREHLSYADDQRMFLEDDIDALQIAYFRLEKEVLELKVQLQQLRNLPNHFDQAFRWVAHGFDLAGNTLREQQQQ